MHSECKKQPRCGGAVFYLARRRIPPPAISVHFAARHACASRSPSYRCTSPPALLARPTAAGRFIPPVSVSVHPAARCACTPPSTAVPIHTAGLRARASRRPPRRCISPPPSRFILPQSRPPYPVPQQRIPLPYLFRGKNHRSIFRFTARHAARHCIPPQRTPAPPFALRQESLRSILSNKERRSQIGPARRVGKRGRTSRPVPLPLVPPERAKPACPRRRAFCRRTACKTSIHTTTPYTHLNTPSSLHAAARDAPYSTPPQETLISILFCGKRHRSYFLLQL